jgi:protein-tyrosine phosphatase
MLDIHNHSLPGIDDGAENMETTLEMLRVAKADGINQIIVTPHFCKYYYENNYQDVIKLINMVKGQAEEANIYMDIMPGQEVFLDEFTLELYKQGVIGTLNNSKYMLVEMDPRKLEEEILDVIYELRVQGVVPIIAHPERYVFIQENLSSLNYFLKEGCLFQLNAGSLMGKFGKSVEKTAFSLVNEGFCDFIASDAHSLGVRSPKIRKAFDITTEKSGKILEITEENCRILLNNGEIVINRELFKKKRRIFSFFGR